MAENTPNTTPAALPPGKRTITGVIYDNKRQPLLGASILAIDKNQKPTSVGTTSDSQGKFTLNLNTAQVPAEFVSITNVSLKPALKPISTTTEKTDLGEVILEPQPGEEGEVIIRAARKNPAIAKTAITPNFTPKPPPPIPPPVPPPSAKGLEKFVLTSAKKMVSYQDKITSFFDKFILKPLKAINKIDICNIINYYLSKVTTDKVFKNNPRALEQLKKAQLKASNLNEAITKYTAFSTISNNARTQETVSTTAPTNADRSAEKEKLLNVLTELRRLGPEITQSVTPLLSVIPGTGKLRSTLEDLTGYFGKYRTIADIPNQDIQKLVNKLYDVQGILGAISTLNSAQGLVNLLQIQKQVEQLQKTLNPAQLIPAVKSILKAVKSLTQAGLQILKIITFARTIVRLVTTLVKVLDIIVKLFHTLPLPNMFTVFGINSTLETVKNTIQRQKETILKVLSQINRLLVLVYDFVLFLLEKINLVEQEITILLVKLTACEQLKDNPVIKEAQRALEDLKDVKRKLEQFANNYAQAQADLLNKVKIPGYTIGIVEEELVDEGKTLKRRRAVAYDDKGVLVLEGNLSFATNTVVLVEELRLQLVSRGLVQGTDNSLGIEDQQLLDSVAGSLDLTLEDDNAFDEDGAAEDVAETQKDLDNFITGLKNGEKLKKKVRKRVQDSVSKTKSQIQDQGIAATSSNTSGVNAIERTTSSSIAETTTAKLLTKAERAKLKATITAAKFSRNPLIQKEAEKAKKRLAEDDAARERLEGG